MTIQTSRRNFLKGAAAVGAGLVIGLDPRTGALAASDTPAALNPFVQIDADGVVTVLLKHFEMGQGTTTGLTTLVAEELDANWDGVQIAFAPSDDKLYGNLLFGSQGTGGSTAIANSFMQYRQAGAAARAVLVQAAAEAWGVSAADVTVENGVISAGGETAGFGEFIDAAAKLTPPEEPALKSPDQFRLIGDPTLRRKDSAAKTDGTAVFAMDVRVPGMVYAMILRAPRFGGTLASFDAAAAADVAGFIDAKALPNGAGVAVYAKNTWAAKQARDAISAAWDFSAAEGRSTDALIDYHLSLLDQPAFEAREGVDRGAVSAAVDGAATVVESEYVFPFLAHAPMETLNCVIEPDGDGGIILHDGCQFPGITHPTLAAVLELPPEKIDIRTVYAGGAFGRRATPTADYQVEAALAFMLLGRTTPVKLVWTREDDIRGGHYRPMAAHRVRVGLDDDGGVVAWDHRIAAKPILKGTIFEPFLVHNGVDETSVEGVSTTPYAIPSMSVGLSDAETQIPVLWWRAVGHTHNAFAMETIVDELATAAKIDPVAFRLEKLLTDPSSKDHQRLAGVLRRVAEEAKWGAPEMAGKNRGVALHKSFNTFVAMIAEVEIEDGAVTVRKVDCAIDCGVVVNPDIVRAQVEGGVGYGLGAVMRNEITFTEGEVDQENFPDYEPLRITDMPEIAVHIVASTEAPTGVGEPATPPVGPAVANAIHQATGQRLRRLPLATNGVDFS